MEAKEKQYYKDKLAVCLLKLLDVNKSDESGGFNIVKSLRKLDAASGISYPIIHKISKGDRNPNMTTLIAIADGLDMKLSEFFQVYDTISDREIKDFQKNKVKSKLRTKVKRKL